LKYQYIDVFVARQANVQSLNAVAFPPLRYSSLSMVPKSPVSTSTIGRVFDDFSTSYKLFWFRGLLEVLKATWGTECVDPGRRAARSLAAKDLLREMVIAAWVPVCVFRLSLGTTDRLQLGCRKLACVAGLSEYSTIPELRAALSSETISAAGLTEILTYVPALFLAPWFAIEMRGIAGGSARVRKARQLAKARAGSRDRPPYWLEGTGSMQRIVLDSTWEAFLRDNLGVLEAFVDQRLAVYLQNQNPNSPGVVRKLRLPVRRQLAASRAYWLTLRDRLRLANQEKVFADIYTRQVLADRFSIDHFLPWSFVAHDQLWNLAPVSTVTNSRKGDALPSSNYITALATLHWTALALMADNRKAMEEYELCFQQTTAALQQQGPAEFVRRYCDILTPQLQIATNQGFPGGWESGHTLGTAFSRETTRTG
jgi:hypothetical protein